MRRRVREFFDALRIAYAAFREQYRRDRLRHQWKWKHRPPALLQKTTDWPPESFGPNFGNATKARPTYGIQQDPKLIDAVAQALANGKKCQTCGHGTGSNTWTMPRPDEPALKEG